MTNEVAKLVDPYVDLGNLLLIDRDPIEEVKINQQTSTGTAAGGEEAEKLLQSIARDNAQYLYNKIWQLPRSIVQGVTCAKVFVFLFVAAAL